MSFEYFSQLTPESINNIKVHKYSRCGNSLLESFLGPWWEFVLKYVPYSISPNALTSIGLFFVLSSTLLFVSYAPQMDKPVPDWVNIYAAVALFLYQTFDAIDGKQARRLKCSSSLGEIFDHGCDAVALFLIIINVGCSTQALLDMINFKFALWSCFLVLYSTHWTYYVTGSFYFTSFSVTEGQFIIMFIHLCCCPLKHTLHLKIYEGMSIFSIFSYLMLGSNLLSLCYYILLIMSGGKGKNGSSVANTSILSPVFPLLYTLVMWLYIDQFSQSKLVERHPTEMLANFGLVFGTLSTKLLLSTIAKVPFPQFDVTLLNVVIFGVAVRFGSPLMELVSLYTTLIITIFCFASFFLRTCIFLSKTLDIPILALPRQMCK